MTDANAPAVTEKPCTQCKEVKVLSEYHRQKGGRFGTHPWCKACCRIRYPKKKQFSKEKRREHNYKARYRIKPSDVDAMLSRQGNACDICGAQFGDRGHAVDHCHETGKVRSLLCRGCNLKLGVIEDRAWAAKANAYLERWRKE